MEHHGAELIGRGRERAELGAALAGALAGGGAVLLAGEAGAGKTALLEDLLAGGGLLALRGRTSELGTPPLGPLAGALRALLRARPGALAGLGPLAPFLAPLLPELGPAPEGGDRAALHEAVRRALASAGRAALVIDDLQWADGATLDVLPSLAAEGIAVLGAYRSDEVGRAHPLRRLRNELRRARLLREVQVGPLEPEASAALAGRALGAAPSPALAAAIHERAEGLPLFVSELAAALAAGGRLRPGPAGLELAPGGGLPIPETLRDAVLLRLDGLPDGARALLQLAAAAGQEFDMALLADLGGAEHLDALAERGLLHEAAPGRGAFRHALTREAVYADTPWARRRALHRELAARAEAAGGQPLEAAQHWLAAQEQGRARAALLSAAAHACGLHAYRDAADAIRRALDAWPDGHDEPGRARALGELGRCAQLSGALPDAARAWREAADAARQLGDPRAAGAAERSLAGAAELQGHWERALAARGAAALAFAEAGLPAEAAAERLAAAAHLRSAARFQAALGLLDAAGADAEAAGRPDLRARALALRGNVLARAGRAPEGLALVREGLALALEHTQAGVAAEAYQRLADSLEHAGDYGGARETYLAAFDFCQASAIPATAQLCSACLSVVLRQTGEWERAMAVCREVLASDHSAPHARAVASGVLGSLYAQRGQPRLARPPLAESAALARRIELAAMELLSSWGLALAAEAEGDVGAAAEHYRAALDRWAQVEERHYVVPALRGAASCFAAAGAAADVRAAAGALARIAADTGQPEALSALAHALGEAALLDGDSPEAARQLERSLELLREVSAPFCQALTQLRAAAACAAAGRRQDAAGHAAAAYRAARRLGARPLCAAAARQLEALGEPVAERVGLGAAGRLRAADLTRRQREVLALVARGLTSAEIARALVLSPRTVEMHVSGILAALDSRSRAEAVRRAAELGLLGEYGGGPEKVP